MKWQMWDKHKVKTERETGQDMFGEHTLRNSISFYQDPNREQLVMPTLRWLWVMTLLWSCSMVTPAPALLCALLISLGADLWTALFSQWHRCTFWRGECGRNKFSHRMSPISCCWSTGTDWWSPGDKVILTSLQQHHSLLKGLFFCPKYVDILTVILQGKV